jgi:hypothetical protein
MPILVPAFPFRRRCLKCMWCEILLVYSSFFEFFVDARVRGMTGAYDLLLARGRSALYRLVTLKEYSPTVLFVPLLRVPLTLRI